jgi:hypothetical protein
LGNIEKELGEIKEKDANTRQWTVAKALRGS